MLVRVQTLKCRLNQGVTTRSYRTTFDGAVGKQKKKTPCPDSSSGTISARQKTALVKLSMERAKRKKKRAPLDSSILPSPLLASDKPSPKKKKKSSPDPSSTGASSKKSLLVGPASIKPSAKKKASSSDAVSAKPFWEEESVCWLFFLIFGDYSIKVSFGSCPWGDITSFCFFFLCCCSCN